MAKKGKTESDVMVTENGDAICSPPQVGSNGDAAKQKKPPRDKRESFLRLAERRVNRAVKMIESIIPLANGAAYTYEEAEGKAIVGALAKAVEDVSRAFQGQKKERPTFTLRSLCANGAGASGT